MTDISKSSEKGSFHVANVTKRLEEGDITIEEAEQQIAFYRSWQDNVQSQEASPEWQQNNMEYDLRSTMWIVEKVRSDDVYAQHLYAALCNNNFQKNEVWLTLKKKTWGCSWRYAGGIIADMQGKGDYIDWYCSGINGEELPPDQVDLLDHKQKEYYLESRRYVGESVVTEEVRADLFRLGWIVLEQEDDLD